MLRCTILVVLLAGLALAATDDDNSTSTTPLPTTSTTATSVDVNVGQNKTKEGAGKGYGHDGGRRYRGRHEDHDYYHRDEIVSPFPDVKSYFDTHYCSVHGSFALSFNEKVEDKSYEQSGGYGGRTGGGYGTQSGSYGGQSDDQYGGNSGGYGQSSGYGGGYGKQESGYGSNGYSEKKEKETKFIRKVTRQYCRYTASWSDKACKFCCRVVARSAYTNPDDITAAIFSFNPANPAAGGAGIEAPKVRDSSPAASYGAPPQQSYEQDGGYGSQGGQYGGNSGGYEQGGQNYEQQNGGGNYGQQGQQYQGAPPPPPVYQQPPPPPPPPAYGNGNPQYRSKRSNGYPAPPVEQYGAPDAQSYDTPGGYENQPTYEVEDVKPVNQCVCCAPKHRYY